METWVLIIILLGGNSPVISSVEFKGKENCMTAKSDLHNSTVIGRSKIECYLKYGELK